MVNKMMNATTLLNNKFQSFFDNKENQSRINLLEIEVEYHSEQVAYAAQWLTDAINSNKEVIAQTRVENNGEALSYEQEREELRRNSHIADLRVELQKRRGDLERIGNQLSLEKGPFTLESGLALVLTITFAVMLTMPADLFRLLNRSV